jgi:vancomycin permeability regulator SanA
MTKRTSCFTRLLRWGSIIVFLVFLPRIITTLAAVPHTYSLDDLPETEYGVVLAAETINGRPSAVLRHRIERGVDLYLAGKVQTLVMSGRDPEPAIMREYAISLGVPEADILLDDGGIRTYATCYNSLNLLGLEEAVFVTQPFHLPRTLFLCRALGIEASGVAAYHGRYWRGSWIAWNIRETLATILAFQDLYIQTPDTSEYASYAQGETHHD